MNCYSKTKMFSLPSKGLVRSLRIRSEFPHSLDGPKAIRAVAFRSPSFIIKPSSSNTMTTLFDSKFSAILIVFLQTLSNRN